MTTAYRVQEEFGVVDAPQRTKEEDRQHKLKIVQRLQTLWKESLLPENAELDLLLKKFVSSRDIHRLGDQLSRDGGNLLEDVQRLARTLQITLRDKNQDDLAQHFLYHARLATKAATRDRELKSKVMKVVERGKEKQPEWSDLLLVARLMVFDSNFRGLLEESQELVRKMFYPRGKGKQVEMEPLRAQAVQMAKARARVPSSFETVPEEPQASTSGQPVVSGQPVEEVKRISMEEGKRVDRAAFAARASMVSTAESTRGRADSGYYDIVPKEAVPFEQIQPPAPPATPQQEQKVVQPYIQTSVQPESSAQAQSSVQAPTPGRSSIQAPAEVVQAPTEPTEKKPLLTYDLEAPKPTSKQTVAIHRPSKAEEQDENYQLILQLKQVIDRMNANPNYQSAIIALVSFFYGWQMQVTGTISQTPSPTLAWDVNAREAQKEFRLIMEAFANDKSMEPLLNSINTMTNEVKEDDQMTAFLYKVKDYLKQLFNRRSYLVHHKSTLRGIELLKQGQHLLSHKYKDLFSHVLDESRAFVDSMKTDKLTQQLVTDLRKVNSDLFLNDSGEFTFKKSLMDDVRNVLFPALVQQVQFIPIPRIDYSDPTWAIMADNIILTTQHILPSTFELKVTNDFVWRPQETQHGATIHVFDINLFKIQANVRNVDFYVKHKTFPRTSDRGKAHVVIGGNGMTVRIRLETRTDRDLDAYYYTTGKTPRMFTRREVKVDIDKLALHVTHSRRDTLYSLLVPMLTSMIKKQMQTAIEERVKVALNQLDTRMYETRGKLTTKEGGTSFYQQMWSMVRPKTTVKEKEE